MTVPSSLQGGCEWLMNPADVKTVRKLKDSTGAYLFHADPTSAFGYRLLGKDELCIRDSHIVELKDNWDKRLDSFNLLCCSKEIHQEIHKKYKDNKSKIIKELNEMLEKFREEFEIILN